MRLQRISFNHSDTPPEGGASLSRPSHSGLTPRRAAICSLKAFRADIGRMKTVSSLHQALLVELEEVDALQLAVADAGFEAQDDGAVVG